MLSPLRGDQDDPVVQFIKANCDRFLLLPKNLTLAAGQKHASLGQSTGERGELVRRPRYRQQAQPAEKTGGLWAAV